jgi:hypothetical protein
VCPRKLFGALTWLTANYARDLWDNDILGDIKGFLERFRSHYKRIKDISDAEQLELLRDLRIRVAGFDQANGSGQGRLPCHYIIFPENKFQFFPRESIMQRIKSTLNHDCHDRRPRSLLLYGTGGVGKTQLALAYAYERQKHGVKAVFWINSETKDEALQSCTNICVKLGLNGVVKGGQHNASQTILVEWLGETGERIMADC